MHKIAFIIGDRFVYWTPILLALGVLAAVCMFLALYMGHTGKATGAFVAVPLALVLSLVLGRLVYWCCVPGSYSSLRQVLTDLGTERIALTGIAAGCALAACLVRLMGLTKNLPAMLDAMSLAGLLGIAVGRLNHFFNYGDRVASLNSSNHHISFDPFFADEPVTRVWQATFLLQAAVAAALFVLLLGFLLALGRKRPGDTCLLVCLFYGASQFVLEGMRYDALFLPGISFASLSQLAGVAMMLLVAVLFSARLVRRRGWKWWYLALWVPFAGLLTAACVVEQGTGQAGSAVKTLWITVAACLGAAVVLATAVGLLGVPAGKQTKTET